VLRALKKTMDVKMMQLKEEAKYVQEMIQWVSKSEKMMGGIQRKLEINEESTSASSSLGSTSSASSSAALPDLGGDATAVAAIAAELAHLKLAAGYGATVSQATVFDGHLRPVPTVVENSEEECQACGGTGLLTADSACGLDERELLDPSHPDCPGCGGTGQASHIRQRH
jgi:hypothetical protein